jgi:hypothetical protein
MPFRVISSRLRKNTDADNRIMVAKNLEVASVAVSNGAASCPAKEAANNIYYILQ